MHSVVNPLKYRADIDGLRAIAVVSVLLYHADIGCSGGYVGVDVFFVISGYLITGLILKDCDQGRFGLVEFWERRVRRILPVLAVVILSTLAAGWFLFLPQDFKELGQSVVAQATLMSNVYFWMWSGYFEQTNEVKPLLHTWSLAVEEQFYLLFPLVLVVLNRFSRKALIAVIVLLSSLSFILSVYGSYRHPSATFYLLPARAWELLLGSFLAAIPAGRARPLWLNELLSWSGLLSILCAVFLFNRDTRFPGIAALLPCIGAGLIIWANGHNANGHNLTSVGKFLATRPVVFIGLISYSLYLWHWPVLVFSKYWTLGEIPLPRRLLLLLASMMLAVLTWRFVETPFRKRLVFKSRSQIFTLASLSTVVLLLAGLAINKMQGVPSRIPAEVRQYADGATDRIFRREVGLEEALKGDFVELGTGDKDQPIELLVWGDSHAKAVMPVLDLLCKEYAVRGVGAAHASTPPLAGYASQDQWGLKEDSIAFNHGVVEFIRKEHVYNVLLVARWSYYVNESGTTRVRHDLLDTIAALKDPGSGIWIMKGVPQHRWNVPRALASTAFFGGDPAQTGIPLAAHRAESRLVDQVFEGIAGPGIAVLDPTDLFVGSTDLCRVEDNGRALYCDNHHLTTRGAMVLRPLFEPIFQSIANSRPALPAVHPSLKTGGINGSPLVDN